jgi:hypothetical protein
MMMGLDSASMANVPSENKTELKIVAYYNENKS